MHMTWKPSLILSIICICICFFSFFLLFKKCIFLILSGLFSHPNSNSHLLLRLLQTRLGQSTSEPTYLSIYLFVYSFVYLGNWGARRKAGGGFSGCFFPLSFFLWFSSSLSLSIGSFVPYWIALSPWWFMWLHPSLGIEPSLHIRPQRHHQHRHHQHRRRGRKCIASE